MDKKKVAIVGASGFVGSHLIDYLEENYDHHLVALSRSKPKGDVEHRPCDLFSLLDIENGLDGCDTAIYLVHSMGPTAHLDQGNFRDYDLIVVDNFLRACKRKQIKQIIYLGGIIPKDESKLSSHLESRLEVEEFIKSSHIPVTVFRAGMIMGTGGSSFNIMLNLINRLPILGLPDWTKTETQPVHIDFVVECLSESIGEQKHFYKTYELANCDIMTYEKMLKITAEELGVKRKFIHVPWITRDISKFWISTVSGAPRSLVFPLVEGLNHKIVADPKLEFKETKHDFVELLKKSLHSNDVGEALTPHAFKKGVRKKNNEVRSVQRLILPRGLRAIDIAYEYMNWLPLYLRFFIRVSVRDDLVRFILWPFGLTLLVLKHSPERSSTDRQLFYVVDGFLNAKTKRGRLEFREVLDGKYIISAIHEFKPRLPWMIYIFTQAPIHLKVMNAFGRWLEIINKRNIEKDRTRNKISQSSNI